MTGLTRALLQLIEPVVYGPRGRPLSILFLCLSSLWLGGQALQLRPDASFEKNLPLDHPYMQVLRQYHADFGGANSVLVALIQDSGDIYNAAFLQALQSATSEITFIPGIDRSRVASLFTRNISFIEVDEEGFAGDNVVPPDYAPSPEMFELIRLNVGKAGLVGQLVSLDQRGAMISTEVLEHDPVSGRPSDLVAIARQLETQVRDRLTSPTRYELIVREQTPGLSIGERALVLYESPGWLHRWRDYSLRQVGENGRSRLLQIPGRALAWREVANPDYVPGLSVHILGFTSVVGAVAAATGEVLGFFALTVGLSMLVLWAYLGSWRLALLPLACSLLAVLWEFGLLRALGYGLDPFAILVPFLVLAVSTSHGVQYVNRWADEIADGASPRQASIATFRRLFIPGAIAILTNIAGFMTIALVPIDAVREMAVNASLGMLAVLIANKLLMPIWLAGLQVHDVAAFRRHREITRRRGDHLWRPLSRVTEPAPALALIACAALVLAASLWLARDRIIGDAQAGVPELRPDSTYNRDVVAILDNFALGTDVLKIIAETAPDACIDFASLDQVDRFAWRIRNTEGVTAVMSATQVARQIYAAMNENNPNFLVLPRNRYSLVLATTPIESSSGLLNYDCTAMPVIVFASDHRAATIDRIVAEAERFNALNRQEFAASHPDFDPAACDQRSALRRDMGQAQADQRKLLDALIADGLAEAAAREHPQMRALGERIDALRNAWTGLPQACPVNFALATGNLGVMAATNAVVEAAEWPALAWVYAVVFALLLLSYRSLRAWLVIGIPLFLVSVFANALMAQLGIGLKVATLPVVTLAVGIGVDYGIYIYDVLRNKHAAQGGSLRQAYLDTLHETGKAVIFTGLVLAGSVATWLASELQFQRDMGLLLIFMFSANMLGAVLLCPALYRLLHWREPR